MVKKDIKKFTNLIHIIKTEILNKFFSLIKKIFVKFKIFKSRALYTEYTQTHTHRHTHIDKHNER